MKAPRRKPSYRLAADRSGLQLSLDENFWNDTVVRCDGTTALDNNIETIIQEIRAALYVVGTNGTNH